MRRFVTTLVLVMLAVACDSTTEPVTVDEFPLMTVDGENPPVTVVDEPGNRVEVLDGIIRLRSDGTFTDLITLRRTVNGSVTTEDNVVEGTYTVDGSTIRLTNSYGDQSTLSRDGDVLSRDFGGAILVYREMAEPYE